MRRYLGLDLSLKSPGFAVIELRDNIPVLVHVSHKKTNAKATHGSRLEDIRAELSDVYSKYKPFDAVIKEKGFSRFAVETQALYKTHGIAEWYLRDHKVEEIPPSTVKKLLTGSGKASKEEVATAVCHYVGVCEFATDDESDSAAVILAYLLQKGLIE